MDPDHEHSEGHEEQHHMPQEDHSHDDPSHVTDENISFSVGVTYQKPGSAPPKSKPVHPNPVSFPPGSHPSQPHPNPVSFPPNQNKSPVSFPPNQIPAPVSFPPNQNLNPVSFPPNQNPNPVSFPPSPNPNPVGFQPPGHHAYQQSQTPNPATFAPGPGLVVLQPSPVSGIPKPQFQGSGNPWSTSLFDCSQDPTNALITCCFPCVTFGQIAEILDNGQTSCETGGVIYGALSLLVVAPFIYAYGYRSKLRSRYNLDEVPGADWLVHFVCPCCALCQAYRELRHQGWDPPIGWQENMRLQQGLAVQMTAPNPPAMVYNM